MNLHDQIKTFDLLTMVAIIIGLSLVFGFGFAGLGSEVSDDLVSALEIFDVSQQWPLTLQAAEFPFLAMGNFYDQFYAALEDMVSVPLAYVDTVPQFWDSLSRYSELIARGYGQDVLRGQQDYSGQIMGVMIIRSEQP